jgi:hypothetical protein
MFSALIFTIGTSRIRECGIADLHVGFRDLVPIVENKRCDREARHLGCGVKVGKSSTDHAEEGGHDECDEVHDEPKDCDKFAFNA